jgi:hypothetical protein
VLGDVAGARLLAEYLEYARAGGVPVAASGSGTGSRSAFEADVAARLASLGITLVPQYGVGGYRVDFAAAHPDDPAPVDEPVSADDPAPPPDELAPSADPVPNRDSVTPRTPQAPLAPEVSAARDGSPVLDTRRAPIALPAGDPVPARARQPQTVNRRRRSPVSCRA